MVKLCVVQIKCFSTIYFLCHIATAHHIITTGASQAAVMADSMMMRDAAKVTLMLALGGPEAHVVAVIVHCLNWEWKLEMPVEFGLGKAIVAQTCLGGITIEHCKGPQLYCNLNVFST